MPLRAATGRTAQWSGPVESVEGDRAGFSEQDLANVQPYLTQFGYPVADTGLWEVLPSDDNLSWPQLTIQVTGHDESGGHTLYRVDCSLIPSADNKPAVGWRAPKRLKQLREDLHDRVKSELGAEAFKTLIPEMFAKRGGLPGTTALLNIWCQSLARCLNSGSAPPRLTAFVLQFLEIPAQEGTPQEAVDQQLDWGIDVTGRKDESPPTTSAEVVSPSAEAHDAEVPPPPAPHVEQRRSAPAAFEPPDRASGSNGASPTSAGLLATVGRRPSSGPAPEEPSWFKEEGNTSPLAEEAVVSKTYSRPDEASDEDDLPLPPAEDRAGHAVQKPPVEPAEASEEEPAPIEPVEDEEPTSTQPVREEPPEPETRDEPGKVEPAMDELPAVIQVDKHEMVEEVAAESATKEGAAEEVSDEALGLEAPVAKEEPVAAEPVTEAVAEPAPKEELAFAESVQKEEEPSATETVKQEATTEEPPDREPAPTEEPAAAEPVPKEEFAAAEPAPKEVLADAEEEVKIRGGIDEEF